MSKLDAAIAGSDYITVTIDGVTHSLTESHPNYEKAREALKIRDADLLSTLVDIPKSINTFSGGKVTVEGGVIMFSGKAIHNSLTRRMIEMMKEGFDITSLANFLKNIQGNPSFRAVNELYTFLEENKLPITDDGHFLAYKRVRSNFTDIFTGTFDNSPGKTCAMPRNQVNEDKDQTCSEGLHFCSIEYLPHFGSYGGNDNIVIVKINPRDVVSIPSDYNNAKGRTCRYVVVDQWMGWEEFVKEQKDFFDKSVVNDYTPPSTKGSDGETLMDFDQAADLICGHTQNPASSLRKRINRGTIRTVNGQVVVDGFYTPPVTIDETPSKVDMTDDEKKDTRAWKNGWTAGRDAALNDVYSPTSGVEAHLTDEQRQNPGLYTEGFRAGYEGIQPIEVIDDVIDAKTGEVNSIEWHRGFSEGIVMADKDIVDNDVYGDGYDDIAGEPGDRNAGFIVGYDEAYEAWVKSGKGRRAGASNSEDSKHTDRSWIQGITDGMSSGKMDKVSGKTKDGWHRPPDNVSRTDYYTEAYTLAYERVWDNSGWNWFDGDR